MKNPYFILFLSLLIISCSSEEPDDPMVPDEDDMQEEGIPGDYIGTWDDNIYTNFPISARIMEAGTDRYSGPFFYSQGGSFVPCCMDSDNNGTISFKVEGDSIKNFIYDQQLEFYMGGCPGIYRGDGTIGSNGWLLINFEGDDCDGSHEGGKIVLRK